MKNITITIDTFTSYRESRVGICAECSATRDDTDLDANNYECPSCGKFAVHGTEMALICGLIEFEEAPDGPVYSDDPGVW